MDIMTPDDWIRKHVFLEVSWFHFFQNHIFGTRTFRRENSWTDRFETFAAWDCKPWFLRCWWVKALLWWMVVNDKMSMIKNGTPKGIAYINLSGYNVTFFMFLFRLIFVTNAECLQLVGLAPFLGADTLTRRYWVTVEDPSSMFLQCWCLLGCNVAMWCDHRLCLLQTFFVGFKS